MPEKLKHPLERSAADLFRHSWLSPEAKGLLAPDLTAGIYLLLLAKRELFDDAVQCLAFAMPNRQAVWWLCQCLWHLREAYSSPTDQAAIKAAVRWVIEPSPTTVAAAERSSDEARFDSAARCVANAAFLAGHGSDMDAPVTTERQRMAAQLVAGALSLSMLAVPAAGVDLSLRQVLTLGYDVVHGISRWDTILAAHALSQTP